MAEINSNTNILPNNPMKAHDLLDHLKKVKGNVGWYEFNLRTLVAAYPEDKVFKQALEAELATAKAAAGKPATKPATGNTKGKKTAAEVKAASAKAAKGEPKEKGSSLPPTTEELEELASIGNQRRQP